MLTLLFWNLNRRPLAHRIAQICRSHEVDCVALAECEDPIRETRLLNQSVSPTYFPIETRSRLTFLTRIDPDRFHPLKETKYYSIFEMAGQSHGEGLVLALAHLPSKREVSEKSQATDATRLAESIVASEDQVGHARTVLVGDLNMNPFEFGVISGSGLHAVMTKSIAMNRSRIVREREYRYFYNPMWRFFGDGSPGPAGTHYYRKSDVECYYWNIFDQVLIRPDLLEHLPHDAVRILETDGSVSLTGPDGIPDRARASDHLPICVRLTV